MINYQLHRRRFYIYNEIGRVKAQIQVWGLYINFPRQEILLQI